MGNRFSRRIKRQIDRMQVESGQNSGRFFHSALAGVECAKLSSRDETKSGPPLQVVV